jgi:LPS export ABC transporter protein LptC
VNDPKVIDDLTKNKIMVDEAKNVVSYLSQQGKLKAKLTAPIMNRYQADTVYFDFPNTLHVDFYDDSARLESWLDSKHGKYFESLNRVYLWDSVIVINRNGDTMKSPDLWWDQNTKLFYTDKLAEFHTKSKQIMGGKGAEATQDLTAITFKQPTGHVLVNEQEFSGDTTRK